MRLGKMHAMRAHADGKRGIVGDQQNQIARMGDARQGFRQMHAMGGLARTHDHHRALRQCARSGERIGEALVIRQQDQRGQAATRVEPGGLPC